MHVMVFIPLSCMCSAFLDAQSLQITKKEYYFMRDVCGCICSRGDQPDHPQLSAVPAKALPFKYPRISRGGGSLLILVKTKLFGLPDQNLQ